MVEGQFFLWEASALDKQDEACAIPQGDSSTRGDLHGMGDLDTTTLFHGLSKRADSSKGVKCSQARRSELPEVLGSSLNVSIAVPAYRNFAFREEDLLVPGRLNRREVVFHEEVQWRHGQP